ncbi:hypothetical protein HPB47_005951 [Ixodes persulcatus]|uniref:Uncharacterized protein n=1 Tax=Ixodes persulcatus TaxID=34615 RepID=A0AC60PBM0_IXOPE|nr:hypothetical protein HPB47_005951 [Ixodes persulcatus]
MVYCLEIVATPGKPWLMTPFFSPSSAAEVAYNASHSTTRSIVERTIGQLKRRFHCLHAELRMQPERCCDITVACCVLHNLAKTYPCSMPRTVLPEEVPVEPVAAGRDESNEARHARQDCPASGASCFSCGRAGHFANVCRSRPRVDHYQQQLAFPAGRRASVRNDYRRQAEPSPTGTPVQGITFPDYELPATICTVAPPDDFPERCRFCGGPCHQRKFCPAAHRRCFSCQKQGHLDRVCESRPRCLRLDRGGPSNPPTVFEFGRRRRRKMRHPSAQQSRPRGGTLPPEPPFPAAAPPAVPAAAPLVAAPSAAALPAAPPTVPVEILEPVPKENPSPGTSPDNSWSSSTTGDSPTVLAPPPVSVCSTPSPEPPEPLGQDTSTPRQDSRPHQAWLLPERLKDYFFVNFFSSSSFGQVREI